MAKYKCPKRDCRWTVKESLLSSIPIVGVALGGFIPEAICPNCENETLTYISDKSSFYCGSCNQYFRGFTCPICSTIISKPAGLFS